MRLRGNGLGPAFLGVRDHARFGYPVPDLNNESNLIQDRHAFDKLAEILVQVELGEVALVDMPLELRGCYLVLFDASLIPEAMFVALQIFRPLF